MVHLHILKQSMAAARKGENWTPDDLQEAVDEVREGKLSIRNAATKYGIPRSTINDHSRMKLETIKPRPGPSPVLIDNRGRKGISGLDHFNG